MSFPIQNTAKTAAIYNIVGKMEDAANKNAAALLETNKAIGVAVQAWLELQDEQSRTAFFAAIEAAVSAGVAKKIERHPLRPAAVVPIVEAARKEAERKREEQKDKDKSARKAREWAKFQELNAIYGGVAAANAPESDA